MENGRNENIGKCNELKLQGNTPSAATERSVKMTLRLWITIRFLFQNFDLRVFNNVATYYDFVMYSVTFKNRPRSSNFYVKEIFQCYCSS